MDKRNLLRHSFNISVITILSRLLGLVRVRLEAMVLGCGGIASGWFFAFALPNLFRRLFGEGALGQALIPLVADAEHQGSDNQVKRELAVVFAWLALVLAVIVVLFSGTAWLLLKILDGDQLEFRARVFLHLVPLLMPYAFFMCLVGVMTAVLNYSKVFVLPALGALLLNIFMISGLGFILKTGFGAGDDFFKSLKLLSFLVVSSGIVQLILMLVLLKVYNRFPDFRWRTLRENAVLKKLVKLWLPGFFAGAILQLSFLADRGIAMFIGDKAVPALTYVDRLIDLPIGIFAVSLSSVLMASMSRSAAEGNNDEIVSELVYSLRQVFFICIPMAGGIIFFHELMLRLLCFGGNFTQDGLAAAKYVAIFYSIGIPFFCTVKVITPCFLARKQMMTSFLVSTAAIICNIVLNLILMLPLKQNGIALATVISSVLTNFALLTILHKQGFDLPLGKLLLSMTKIVILTAVAGTIIYLLGFAKCDINECWIRQFVRLAAAGTLFVVIYFCGAKILRLPELNDLFNTLRSRKRNATR